MSTLYWRTVYPRLYQLIAEHDFTKASIVRQAVGRGILHLCKSEQTSAKLNLVENLETTLTRLLPKPNNMHSKLVDFVEKAVGVSNDMSEEQGAFRCFMATSGEIAPESTVHIADDQQRGPVLMCTFPGFEKEIEFHERKPFLKAVAELESTFNDER